MSDRRQRADRREGARRIADLVAHGKDHAHITPGALASYLAVDRRTVMKWIESELLPAYRFVTRPDAQGEWRIRTDDAITFIDRHRFRVLPPARSS